MGGHNHTAVAQGLDWRLPGISICPPPRFESGEGVMEMTGGEALSLTRPVPLSCLSGDLWGDRHSTWWGKLLAIPTSQPGQAWPSNYWGHCWLPWLSVALSGSQLWISNYQLWRFLQGHHWISDGNIMPVNSTLNREFVDPSGLRGQELVDMTRTRSGQATPPPSHFDVEFS